jgi:PII-like signaling protein
VKIETDAKLLTIYINGTDQWHGQPLYSAIVSLCKDRSIAGATVIRCAEGYGGSGHLHTARLLALSENLPVRLEIVDIAERIEPLVPVLEAMIGEGLLTITNVHIRRYLRDPKT